MKPEKQDDDLRLLKRTLDNMGIEIRTGRFDGDGGLAKIEGRYVMFVRSGVSAEKECLLYLDAIRKLGASATHLPPRVRLLLGEKEWE